MSANLKIFSPKKKYKDELSKQFPDNEVITINDLKLSKDFITHIPISPLLMPNSKLYLHFYTLYRKKKLILNYHGDIRKEFHFRLLGGEGISWHYLPSYFSTPHLLKSAEVVITHSTLIENIISGYGVKKSIVLPNGLDDFWYEKNKTSINLDGNPSIFFHGRLTRLKGAHVLLEGVAKAINQHSELIVYIAGDGKQKNHLEKLSTKLGIENNIVFLGNINEQLVKSYLCNTDASIYPSLWDNFPLTVLEALSCANGPVFFSSISGIKDFSRKDGFNLFSFDPSAETVCKIVKKISMKDYDKKVIEDQKEFTSKYTWDLVVEEYIKLYNQICNVS